MLPDLIYNYNGVEQHIVQMINDGFSFPEKIKIVKAELYTFNRMPRETVWKDGTGRIQPTWTFPLWLRLYDEDGYCGEGRILPEVWDSFVPMMLAEKRALTNLEWRRIFYWWNRGRRANYRAMSNIEMVLFDLIARRRNAPMHRLLGADHDWVDVYKGGGSVLLTDEQLVAEMVKIKEEGYRRTKIKIGLHGRDFSHDLRRLEKVRKALGDDFGIAVDANEAWDAETSMAFLREAYQYNISWFEEPIMQMEIEEHAKLVRMMKEENKEVPVAAGEGENIFETFRSYVDAGVQMVMPYPSFYCMAELIRTIDYCRDHGCIVTTGQGWDFGVVIGTLMKPGELVEFHKPNQEYMEDYFSIRSELKDGRIYLPDIPGIPVRVDMERLDKDGVLAGVKHLHR